MRKPLSERNVDATGQAGERKERPDGRHKQTVARDCGAADGCRSGRAPGRSRLTRQGEGVSRANLLAHGWICVEFLPANRWSCFNPGLGRPFPGNPDPRPTYNFVAFDRSSGEFIYTGHLIRGDLYSGQPCAPGEDAYVFRPLIGYYECVHL
jgi:hypothetical protein